ncbi:hypothetical protein NEUTE1DRAFT_116121 [Neurospora tetrasperma FGSC 2508]|uniref:Uncharacterized protein n=1 Tax=Neurospora tetrasperma (strain FGSC 2508 / ATCC MYA-4615 / P0657) TaxID=510951 RepID=F8MDI6_NEUT8|nr:uncharacterized protein NEUTE1DRAFT_116121 [Neurospora tetrasperma FGSC 2508]EGO61477.1 hypothetical protein NEUTE1DRAFT_116121 [Neurospora tetrasperma FGSC 2508]EGZ74490.1 hypothetical protein NEUTE2DRAFT_143363 [Neurospora tetrasperma FGSC 2509]
MKQLIFRQVACNCSSTYSSAFSHPSPMLCFLLLWLRTNTYLLLLLPPSRPPPWSHVLMSAYARPVSR